jgi:hypothetical protein
MRRLVAGCAATLLAATVVVACGSSSKPEANSGTTTTNASSAAATNGGNNTDFAAVLNRIAKQKFKVTWTDSSNNEHTYAQDGNGNTASIDGDSELFGTPTSIVRCDKTGDAWSCTQMPVAAGGNSQYLAQSAAEKNYVAAVADRFGSRSSKTIAGRIADCFTITAADFGAASAGASALGASLKGALTYCNDRGTGAVLENTVTSEEGDASAQLLVTKFEEPSAADFQPPATPTIVTIPAITPPGGVGAQ